MIGKVNLKPTAPVQRERLTTNWRNETENIHNVCNEVQTVSWEQVDHDALDEVLEQVDQLEPLDEA